MRTIDLSTLTWRKSTYSNQDGGECIEVSDDLLATATWRKSSYSNSDGGQCVEVSHDFLATATWRKSTHSNPDGGACIEVSHDFPALVPVRDSKNPQGPILTFEVSAWSFFVTAVKSGELHGA